MFPFDILEQAFQGNPVAWYCVGFGIGFVALTFAALIVWWKLPQNCKSQFFNNLTGGTKPTVLQCHEDKRARFINPTMYSNGFAYFRGLVYIPLKQWLTKDSELNEVEKDTATAVYGLEGTQSALYLNYSKSGAIVNPEVVAYIQNEKALNKLQTDKKVTIDRQKFIDFLSKLSDKTITIEPLNLNFPIKDIRKFKEWLPKSLNKSDFVEFENKIRQDERGNKQGVNYQAIIVVLLLINLLLGGLGMAKQFGLF